MVRRRLCRRSVAIAFAACLWVAPGASATTFTVDDTSTDAPLATSTSTTCVSSDGHSGCTLRAAIQAADNAGGATEITLPAATITFSIAPVAAAGGDDAPAHGDLDVDALNGQMTPPAITIIGQGARSTVIDAASLSRAFAVHLSASLTLEALAITGGSSSGTASAQSTINPGDGGAIFSQGAVTITDSELYGNGAGHEGGAIYNDGTALTVTGSTFTANVDNVGGGGVANLSASDTTLVNDTLDHNNGVGDGGGLAYYAQTAAGSKVQNVTITRNNARTSGGIYGSHYAGTIENTIVAGNTGGPNCDAAAGAADGGGNVDSDATCFSSANGDETNDDPNLGSLADNGGPSETDAVLAGSPAIGLSSQHACPPQDQRGVARLSSACDSGAYQGDEADLRAVVDAPLIALTATEIDDAFRVTNEGPYSGDVTFTDPLPGGATYLNASTTQGNCAGGATVTCSLGTLASGQSATVTVALATDQPGPLSNIASVSTTAIDPDTDNNSAVAATQVSTPPSSGVSTPTPTPTGPVNTVAPVIRGKLLEGATLSASTGTWANAPTSFQYAWLSCDNDTTPGSCTPISGATSPTYVVADALAGSYLRVAVAATNGVGSRTVTSAATAAVQPAVDGSVPPAPPPPPGGDAATVYYTCHDSHGQTNLACILIFVLTGHAPSVTRNAPTRASEAHTKTVVLGRETATVKPGHKQVIKIRLNATGRRLLAKKHTLKVKLTITQKHGKTLQRSITFKSRR